MFQLYPYKSGSGSPTYRCEIFSVIVSMAHAMAHLRPHVVLLPSLGFGHLMPLLELSNRLAARGFTVSLVLTPHHAPFAHTKLPKTASDIRILELDVDVNLHRNSNANVNAVAPTVALSQTLLRTPFENLLERMFREGVDGLPPPLCIISDFFLAWTVEVAARFGIPRINVECSPPHAMNLVELLWTRLPRNFERTASGRYIVPGGGDNPTILSASEMSPGLPEADERHPKHLLYKRVFPINQQGSWATVSNTFEELEKIHIGHFQSRYVGPVRAVGPLLPSAGGGRRCSESDWLDGRSAGSVVYVSFGSENSVSSAEMYELALGLELSGKPFLWVLRLPSDVASGAPTEFLPEGFCSRTERRGRIVTGWTDQFAVLSHPAVGGFVTHCGWNSLLEGISCGVPFICWPLSAEQPFNAKFIVEEAKCGVRVPKAADRDEIQRVICSVLDEDESVKGVKRNAMKWKEMAKAAVSEGGSSARNFDGLVDDILSLQKQGNGSAQHFP